MNRLHSAILPFAAALVLACLQGCGQLICNAPDPATLEVTLEPSTVSAGELTKVVVSFDQPVFEGSVYGISDWDVRILDAPDGDWLGTYDDSLYGMENGSGPYFTGVVVSGEVVNDRAIELMVELPSSMQGRSFPVEVFASNGGVECWTGVSGETTLVVE